MFRVYRLTKERGAPVEEPKKPKRRPYNVGTEAPDMSLITPEIAKTKSGWTVTPMGRVVSKIRVRPDHPLPPTLEEQQKLKSAKRKRGGDKSAEKVAGKKKKRVKEGIQRARRVTIDVTKWDSTQLKGIFLESQGVSVPKLQLEEKAEESDEESESEEEEMPVPTKPSKPVVAVARNPSPAPIPVHIPKSMPAPAPTPTTQQPQNDLPDLALEKSQTLNLLSSIFGNDDDWIGQESIGSDVDEEELLKQVRPVKGGKDDVEFEVVPRQRDREKAIAVEKVGVVKDVDENEDEDRDREVGDAEMDEDETEERHDGAVQEEQPAKPSAPTLKDLFAPREEQGQFSIVS